MSKTMGGLVTAKKASAEDLGAADEVVVNRHPTQLSENSDLDPPWLELGPQQQNTGDPKKATT